MIAPSLATSFPLGTGIWISLVCALIGLGAALYLIRVIVGYSPGNETMRRIAGAIEEGAKAYLNRQILSVSVIAVIIFLLLGFTRDFFTAFGFLIGAACSMAAGYIGVRIAVISNCRTAQAATASTEAALRVAFNGGAVTGLLVVGLGLLSVGIFFLVGQQLFGLEKAISSLVGLALGASLISVFARLGGGIYTKAADVGADLVGKIESHLDEDDPRNPATIADNVGDNVGDCAGMAADVFESYEVTLVAAIILAAYALQESDFIAAYGQYAGAFAVKLIMFALILRGVGVFSSIIGIMAGRVPPRKMLDPNPPINICYTTPPIPFAIRVFAPNH